MRADLEIQLRNFKGLSSLSGRIYASADSAGEFRFRLDIFGFPGQVAASWFYQEHHWTLLLHVKREVWEGEGGTFSIPETGQGEEALQLPEAQGLFGFLLGQPLAGFPDRDSLPPAWNGDTLHWSRHGTPWAARFDTTLGICREVFSPILRIKYGHPQSKGNRIVPKQVEVEVEGRPTLSIQVNGWEEVRVWKTNPFVFSIPKGYQRRDQKPAGEQP